MKLLLNLVGFLLILFFIENRVAILLQKCYGSCNKKYCNISVRCRPLNRTSKWNEMNIFIRPGLILEAPINLEIVTYKKYRTVYRPSMIKLKIELCAQLKQLNYTNHPFISLIRNVKFVGNMFDPCPLKDHRYMEPYVPEFDYFPLVPTGEWRMDFIISKTINNSNEFLASWSDFYEVKSTDAEEF